MLYYRRMYMGRGNYSEESKINRYLRESSQAP
jgi:hypothetical protein